jgi:blue copper oxidase
MLKLFLLPLLLLFTACDSDKKSSPKITINTNNTFNTPPLLEYTQKDDEKLFSFNIVKGQTQILEGNKTTTYGYNGSLLGPTIKISRDEKIKFKITNKLDETTTVHWHGMHLPAIMDGGPYQMIHPNTSWEPHWKINNAASTLWYHPHLMGKTGEHVYRGLAGFFLIEDEHSKSLAIPQSYGVDDFPVVLQDRRLDAENQLLYKTNTHDIMGMKGETFIVNGVVNPNLVTTAKIIRLRLLNGSNARIYNLGFEDNTSFYQIASDGGFLENPVALTRLLLGPAERAEILIDATKLNQKVLSLMNLSNEYYTAKYEEHLYGNVITEFKHNDLDFYDKNPHTLMTITVDGKADAEALLTLPDQLTTIIPLNPQEANITRKFKLRAWSGFTINDKTFEFIPTINDKQMSLDRIDEIVKLGSTEIWEITNGASMAHPFHIHDIQFQIIYRADEGGLGKEYEISENEQGWKDTILIYPEQKVRVIMKFEDYADPIYPFMYHCHILEHEDAGMMGQFVVIE